MFDKSVWNELGNWVKKIFCFLNQDLFCSLLLRLRERCEKAAISSCTFDNVLQLQGYLLRAVHLVKFKLVLIFKEKYFCVLSNLTKLILMLILFLMPQKRRTRKGIIFFCL